MSKLNAKNEIEMKKIIEENDTSHSFIATEINLRDEDIDFDLHDTIMNDSRTHSMVMYSFVFILIKSYFNYH